MMDDMDLRPRAITFANLTKRREIDMGPTHKLRWKGGVLQQTHCIEVWDNGQLVDRRFEWRDVPAEE